MELIGPYLVACVLLVVAGVAKVVRPGDTARAVGQLLAGAGHPVPVHRLRLLGGTVRVGAAAEAAVGVVALALPRTVPAVLVAASYLAFAAVVAVAMARGGALATCGCLGRPDTPPTLVHLVLNLVLAGAAAVVAATAAAGATLPSVLAAQPGHGVPLAVLAAVGLGLAVLVLTRLAALEGVRRQGGTAGAGATR